jgi:membrane-bound serine protease (ClpP class)
MNAALRHRGMHRNPLPAAFCLATMRLLSYGRAHMAVVLILLVLGVVLILLETILPGLVAGIAGIGCLIGAVAIGYTEFSTATGHLLLTAVLVGLIVGFALWAKYFPDSRVARVFISKGEVGNVAAEKPELLDQAGTAFTALRPSGTALINGKRVDVVTEGPFIERGAPIKVVATEGLRVVVRAQTPPERTASNEY